MNITAFLQILGMAFVAGVGGVVIFQVLHWIETHHRTPKQLPLPSSQPVEKKRGVGS